MNTSNSVLSDKDIQKYSVLRHQDHREIRRQTGCGMTTIRSVLTGIQTSQSERARRILAAADKLLKQK